MKHFDLYCVHFIFGYNEVLKFTTDNYEIAKKKFQQYKKNKGYEFYRIHAKALRMDGWNYEDVETTTIKIFELNNSDHQTEKEGAE